ACAVARLPASSSAVSTFFIMEECFLSVHGAAFDHAAPGIVDIMLYNECLAVYLFDLVNNTMHFQAGYHGVNNIYFRIYLPALAKAALALEHGYALAQLQGQGFAY